MRWRWTLIFVLVFVLAPPTILIFVPDAPSQESLVEIGGLETWVSDQTDTEIRWTWRLVLTNRASWTILCAAAIELQDRDGAIIATDVASGLALEPNKTRMFSGSHLIKGTSVRTIAHALAVVRVLP